MQANYESGLRILHIDRETYELTQVGYFDVYPPGTTAEFNGSWSVYPYFKSGARLQYEPRWLKKTDSRLHEVVFGFSDKLVLSQYSSQIYQTCRRITRFEL